MDSASLVDEKKKKMMMMIDNSIFGDNFHISFSIFNRKEQDRDTRSLRDRATGKSKQQETKVRSKEESTGYSRNTGRSSRG